MKAKKKAAGIKQKIREEKKKEQRIALSVFAAVILIAIIFISSFLVNSMLNQPLANQSSTDQTGNSTPELKAAIVDHLSLTAPNQTFVQTATNTLEQAGYSVDYYPSEQTTVGFWRNLPTHGYKIIILRVHSSASSPDGIESPPTFFTSERYVTKNYVQEQLDNRLVMVGFSEDEVKEGKTYFGIRPPFITKSTTGKFQNTTIIMMGCEGLDNEDMAMAFVEKGAKVYIGWNNPVSASHTDLATAHLLQHFLIEKLTLIKSLQETFKEVGTDPHNAYLIYYPPEVGDQTIEDIIGK